jgi:hypothetical protein
LEGLTTDGQGLEQRRDGFSAGLRIASSSRRRALSRRVVGDALSGLSGNVGPGHDENVLNWKQIDRLLDVKALYSAIYTPPPLISKLDYKSSDENRM